MACERQNESREDLILRGLADLDNKFEKFRENTAERLGRLERKPRRSAEDEGFGFGPWMKWMFLLAIAVSLAPVVLEFLARTRGKEKSHGNLSMPQA